MKLMRLKSIWALMLIMAVIAIMLVPWTLWRPVRLDSNAMAAVSNPSPASPGYMMVVLSVVSNISATTTNLIRFKMPWPATLVGVSAVTRDMTAGGHATINVTEAGVSVLTSAITVASSTITEGAISDSAIADEATIGITLTVVSAGTFTDPTIQLNFKRL